jgi:hypothetical protein
MNLPAASSGVSSGPHFKDGLTHEDSSPQAAGNLTLPGLNTFSFFVIEFSCHMAPSKFNFCGVTVMKSSEK